MSNIEKDQEKFFNENSVKNFKIKKDLFYDWANKEQFEGFDWLSDSQTILEYGCGTGGSLDVLFDRHDRAKFNIIGVDIAEMALEKAKEAYPEFKFIKITDNSIPDVLEKSVDASFMFHVLHHSTGHQKMFDEIFSKLKPGGKFLINDLTSRNPIVLLGREVFSRFSFFFAPKFEEDLVVDGKIPEKYRVDVSEKVQQLQQAGFIISEVSYGHLFFFLFHWIDKFTNLSQFSFVKYIYSLIINIESIFTKIPFFHNFCEVVSIKAIKPHDSQKLNSVLGSGDYSDSFNMEVYNQVSVNSHCLDVGCWSGNLGKKLVVSKGCTVEGVEINETAIIKALGNGYAKVYRVNLNSEKLDFSDITTKYDYIVLADVLEHLVNPEAVLTILKDFLKEDGKLVVSVPNVAFILNRLNLLIGNWNYRDFGTLDKTHLKFYTFSTIQKLLKDCGFNIVKIKGYNQFASLKTLGLFKVFFPKIFSYQILITARI